MSNLYKVFYKQRADSDFNFKTYVVANNKKEVRDKFEKSCLINRSVADIASNNVGYIVSIEIISNDVII